MTTTQQDPKLVAIESLIEHVGETLKETLEKIEAPQEVKDLADNLYMLTTSYILISHGHGDDELIQKAMVNALPNVVKAGGQLCTPWGEMPRIEGALLSE